MRLYIKKHLVASFFAILACFNCNAAQQHIASLKELCSVTIAQQVKKEAAQIANASSEQEARSLLVKTEDEIPPTWMPTIVDITGLQWQQKQIKQATPIKRDIKIDPNGKRIFTHQALKDFCKKSQNAEIVDLTFGYESDNGTRHIYATRRDGKTYVLDAENDQYIETFNAPKPQPKKLLDPVKASLKYANRSLHAQANESHVNLTCNGNILDQITLPNTRGGNPTYATSLVLEIYKNSPHLFIGTNNGKLLRACISQTSLTELVTLKRGPRKDSGHKNPIKEILITPNKKHITTTSTHTFRRGPITPSSKNDVIIKLNFGKSHMHSTSSSTGDIVSGGYGEHITVQNKYLQNKQTEKIQGFPTSILTSPLGKHALVGTSAGDVHLITHPHEQAPTLEKLRNALVSQKIKKKCLHASPNTKKRLRLIENVVKENKNKKQRNNFN